VKCKSDEQLHFCCNGGVGVGCAVALLAHVPGAMLAARLLSAWVVMINVHTRINARMLNMGCGCTKLAGSSLTAGMYVRRGFGGVAQ
jgi:hypothetical protein